MARLEKTGLDDRPIAGLRRSGRTGKTESANIPPRLCTHDDSTLGLRLNGRRGDDFVVTFRASRAAPKSGTTFPLSLPQLAGSTMTGGVLVAADAENVKSNLEPRGDCGAIDRAERRDALGTPDSFRGLRQVALRIDSPKADFDATVTTQQQKIETESRAKVEVRAGRLQVEQRIQYRVSYERLSEATLVLPKELRRASVQFTVDRPDLEAKIDPSWTTGEPNGSDIARIPLSPPRIGSFELYAHYSVRLPDSPSQAVEVPIPLVRSRDSAFKTLRVELHAPDDSEFEVVDDSWIPSLAIDKGSTYAWTAKGDQSVLPLRLVRVTALASPGVKIGRALVRSTLDPTGTALTTAQYRIQGPVSRIALTLPAGSTEPKFWLDRLPLKPERIREARPNSGEYLLDIGALSPEPEPVLTVQFGDPNAQSCGLIGSHTLGARPFRTIRRSNRRFGKSRCRLSNIFIWRRAGSPPNSAGSATARYGTDARLRKLPTSTAGWAAPHGPRRTTAILTRSAALVPRRQSSSARWPVRSSSLSERDLRFWRRSCCCDCGRREVC